MKSFVLFLEKSLNILFSIVLKRYKIKFHCLIIPYMRPRIRKLLHSFYSTPDSKTLEMKYNLSGYSDFELLKKIKKSNCQNIKTAIQSILYERGYTPAEISLLT